MSSRYATSVVEPNSVIISASWVWPTWASAFENTMSSNVSQPRGECVWASLRQ